MKKMHQEKKLKADFFIDPFTQSRSSTYKNEWYD